MHTQRPNIFDSQAYPTVPAFVAAMLRWRRVEDPAFSVSAATRALPGCSKALVTRVAKGSRRLTRDRVPSFATLLSLSRQEARYLDDWVAAAPPPPALGRAPGATARPRGPRNQLLSDWVNVYVKDAAALAGFKPDAKALHALLGGVTSVQRIARALDFLFREGFLRRTPSGKVVQDAPVESSTDEVPDARIRRFHKQALEIAKRGVDRFRPGERRADAYVLALNPEHLVELKELLARCMDEVVRFRADHPEGDQKLYQVVMHLTPLTPPEGAAT